MPLRFSHLHGNRRSRCSADGFNDSERPRSTEGKDNNYHFVVDSRSSAARHSPDDEEMEGCLPPDRPISCVKIPLSASSHSDFDLLHHLQHLQIARNNTAVVLALGDVYRQRKELTIPTVFSLDSSDPDTSLEFPECVVYDVDQDSLARAQSHAHTSSHDDHNKSISTWGLIKVCTDFNGRVPSSQNLSVEPI